MILTTGELLIRNCSKQDSGKYKCQIRHQLTHEVISSNSAQLTVTDPQGGIAPRIWTHSQVKVPFGETLELACVAQAWPPATYKWYKEDEESDLISLVPSELSHISEGILVIEHAESHHQGKWVCIANNSVGEERVAIKVVVVEPLMVKVDPSQLTVDIGKSATFNCSVRGLPANHPLIWFKDGRPLVLDHFSGLTSVGEVGRVRMLQPNLLTIRSVTRDDAGSYQCFAQSEFDTSQATVELKLGDTPPVITETFKSGISVDPGTSLSLKCEASATPLPQIRWYLDDINLSLNHFAPFQLGDFVTHQGLVVSYVNITSARVFDGGEYKCVAFNNVGESSFSGRINVIGGPVVRTLGASATGNNLTVVAGRSVNIRCPVIAYPVESINWHHGNLPLPANHRQKVEPSLNGVAGRLHIANVHRNSDQGEYHCQVKGPTGSTVKSSVFLTVKVAPLIDSQPLAEKTFANAGMKVKLMCSILEGDPPIEIRWFKGSSVVPVVSSHNIMLQNSEDYSLLTFKSVQHKDMGNWTCKAWNEVETVNRSSYLVVHVAPTWMIEPKNTHVILGHMAVMDCSAEGSPSPRISWKKASALTSDDSLGDDVVNESPSDFREILSSYRHQIHVNGTLILQEADKSDAGFYMCQVSNGIGAGLSKVVQLIVQIPPYFDTKFISKTVTKGETAVLQCEAQGDQMIRMVWQKDKQKLDVMMDKRYAIKEEVMPNNKILSFFEISSAGRHDSALYTCIATNNFGSDDTNIQLIVQEVPEAPHGILVQDITSRSATVLWKSSFSGNSAITKYIIQFQEDNCTKSGGTDWQEVAATEMRHSIRPLMPTCRYRARVLSENQIGRSDPSMTVEFNTGEEVPGGPPIDVIIEATSSTSMKIKWKPPKKEVQYGKVKGYYIGYKIADSDEPFQYKNVEAMNAEDRNKYEMSYITNLRRKTNYAIILQAYNSVGAGPRTDEVRISTFDSQPPTSPLLEVVTTSADSITLRWDSNINDIEEREFVLNFREEGEPKWHQKKLKTSMNQFVLDSSNGVAKIKCGTKYKLFMTAVNSLGTGEPSETITTRTRGAPPVSPSSPLEFIVANATSALLRLTSWYSGGCPITDFTIKYKPINQKQWIVVGERIRHNEAHYQISNLAGGRQYLLLVSAHSDAGVTEAEYQFTTQNASLLLTVRQSSQDMVSSRSSALSLFSELTVLLPVIISIVVLVVVLGILLGCMRRQHVDQIAVNHDNSYLDQQKSEVTMSTRATSESYPLNEFQLHCESKKYQDNQSPPGSMVPKKLFSNANSTSYYSSPLRKPSLTTHHNHEYAEPCAQRLLQANCCSFDQQFDCQDSPMLAHEKMYSTINKVMNPPKTFS